MQRKKFIATYGPLFVVAYGFSFVLMVFLHGKLHFAGLPGDISLGARFYVPISSAAFLALFVVAFFEMFRYMRRF